MSNKTEKKQDRELVGMRLAPAVRNLIQTLAKSERLTLGALVERVFCAAIEGRSYYATEDGSIPADKKAQIAALRKAFKAEAR